MNIDFIFSDGLSHDASLTEISGTKQICFSYGWLLNPLISGLDADPTYTLEVSDINDSDTFKPYTSAMLDALVTQAFEDDHLVMFWFRINYNAQANTTGTVSFTLSLKK